MKSISIKDIEFNIEEKGYENFWSNIKSWEVKNLEFIKSKVVDLKIDMVLVGPEIPLIEGIQDYLKKDPLTNNTAVIGPSKKGAQLEGSKDFAKNFMQKYWK